MLQKDPEDVIIVVSVARYVNNSRLLQECLFDLLKVPNHFESVYLKLLALNLVNNFIILVEGTQKL